MTKRKENLLDIIKNITPAPTPLRDILQAAQTKRFHEWGTDFGINPLAEIESQELMKIKKREKDSLISVLNSKL